MKEHGNEAEDGNQGGHGTPLNALDMCVLLGSWKSSFSMLVSENQRAADCHLRREQQALGCSCAEGFLAEG